MVNSPVNAAQSILRTLENKPDTKETSRRELFIGYFRELFPKYAWQINEYALGAEKKVKLLTSEKNVVVGRIDTKKGSLVIEYKTDVRSTADQREAEHQLKKYVAGIANAEGKDAVRKAIVTDIINWYEYTIDITATAEQKNVNNTNVQLLDKRAYHFSSEAPSGFVATVERMVFEEVPLIAKADIILDEFGLKSEAYSEFQGDLSKIWQEKRKQSESALGLSLWSLFIENCFDQNAKPDETNYLDHAYLVILSRLLAGYAISNTEEQSEPHFAVSCINGEFFQTGSHRVQNFVEDDFFRWIKDEDVLAKLSAKLDTLRRQLERLDFRSAKKFDLLTELYAEIMPHNQRIEYGEVFTPSWLVNHVVDALKGVEKENIRFLDPACGTGSFLRAVLAKKIEQLDKNPDALEIALNDVCGLDINPISIVIAKTTAMLVLSDLLKESDHPVELPIYLSDSLFLPELKLSASKGNKTVLNLDSQEIQLPSKIFTEGTQLYDKLISIASSAAKDTGLKVISKLDGRAKISANAHEILEGLAYTEDEKDKVIKGLEKIFEVLIDRIQKRRNNVWTFVLKNINRPALLREKFDVVASNPPWLSMSAFPSAKYKSELTSLINEYQLTPKGSSKHHFEISTVFGIHCANTYLKNESQFAYVLPRVILNGFQHEPLRQSKFIEKASLSIDSLWDLIKVVPLFKRPACVVFGTKSCKGTGFPKKLDCLEFTGSPDSLQYKNKKLTLTVLDEKSSYSYSGSVHYRTFTKYKQSFKQGADIMPRRAVMVDITSRINSSILSIATSKAEIENLQNKKPFDKINIRGNIERNYIFNTFKSDAVLPFVAGKPIFAALPVTLEDNHYKILSVSELTKQGHDYAKNWFMKVDKILIKLSGKRLSSWLLRRNKLIDQSPDPCKFCVLYGAGGSNVTSTVIDTSAMNFPFINDQTLYLWRSPTEDEAWYVCGMLNSRSINEAIKGKQPVGAFGEQHVHQLPLSLIPDFDASNSDHKEIATEAKRIHGVATRLVVQDSALMDSMKVLSARRKRFAAKLEPELEKLNFLAESILGIANGR